MAKNQSFYDLQQILTSKVFSDNQNKAEIGLVSFVYKFLVYCETKNVLKLFMAQIKAFEVSNKLRL